MKGKKLAAALERRKKAHGEATAARKAPGSLKKGYPGGRKK